MIKKKPYCVNGVAQKAISIELTKTHKHYDLFIHCKSKTY